jgi:hypothetical protein
MRSVYKLAGVSLLLGAFILALGCSNTSTQKTQGADTSPPPMKVPKRGGGENK